MSTDEYEALEALKKAQQSGQIVIKEADKSGGICIMNQEDYLHEMHSQLQANFTQPDGSVVPFYEKSSESELAKQKTEVTNLIHTGNLQGFISDSDAKEMAPSGKPGRIYGNPKTHKAIPEGKKLPPLRPICSQSGANTEHISKFVDIHAKALLQEE